MADVQAPTSGVETSPPRSTSLDRTRQARPSGAMTHRGPVVNAWADGVMASPRTPRPHQSELRTVGLAVSELQRLCAEDRRVMQRQLDSFDRRLQEHLAAPAASREKWANLQGSVSGLLEEVASLVRRVETLDEKLRIRTASCEELLRQRSRELEQQLHGQQQKVQLAVSTFEEMSKRQTAKLRKVSQSTEEQARKMVALEDTVRRAQGGHTSPLEAMQARLAELEGQQASLEEEFRHVAASSAIAQAMTPTHAAPLDEDYEGQRVAARALESELATLSKQLASQLDEHSAALANLRVRTESQEQRLTAAGDRLEKVVAPTVEAVRNEMQQLRLADRSEIEQQLEHFTRQLKELADSNEEALSEVREHVQASADGQAELQRIREACLMQEQAQRFVAMDPPQREEEINEVLLRVERLENQLETFNHEPVNEKADRADVHRLDLQLQELEQPLRRLSQRTASNEARTTGLEHKLEQFQERLPNAKTDPKTNPAELSSLQAISKQMAEISARLVELEKVQKTQALPNEALRRLEGMEKSLQSTNREGAKLPSDSSLPEQVGTQLDELSGLVSKALKVAENSGSNMQALRFDLVVEQERVAKLNKDLQALTSLVREEQSKMQRSVERQEDQEGRAADALHKMATSIQKVQALQHGFEGSASALNKLVESIVKRVEATEVALKESPNATEVHMLRDSLRADLLEAQQERFQDLESKFLEKAGEKATQEVDDEAFIQEDDDVPDGDITFSEQKAFEQKDVKKTSALELQKEWSNVSQRADEALRLAQGNDELFSSLRDLRPKFEVLERQLLEKVEDCESTLREELVKLEAKTQTVSKMANSSEEAIKDLQKSVNDAMQCVEASEEASKAVREELMSEDLQGEALTLARTCQSDLRGVHSDVADLQASLRKLASHVDQEMEERRGRPLQEVPRRLESRVQDLQKQVAEELEQLAKHQSLITQVLQVEAKVDTQVSK